MGFTDAGSILIGKVSAALVTSAGEMRWASRRIVLELQSFFHAVLTVSCVGASYVEHAAKHHFGGYELDPSHRDFLNQQVWIRIRHDMTRFGMYYRDVNALKQQASDAAPPSSVEFITENIHPAKRSCSAQRRSVLKKHYDMREYEKAGVFPDCVTRDILKDAEDHGATVTIPPPGSEADATLAQRAREGCDVIVMSGDSDVVMYPAGKHEGKIYLKDKANLRVYDWKHKKKVMASMMELPEAVVEANYDLLEHVYLVIALHSRHDYHYKELADGSFQCCTGVGKAKLSLLFSQFSTTFSEHEPPALTGGLLCNPTLLVEYVFKALQHLSSPALKPRVLEAYKGFVLQPVSVTGCGVAPFNNPAVAVLSLVPDVPYTYEGACDGCAPQRSTPWRNWTPTGLQWRRPAVLPRIVLGTVLDHLDTSMTASKAAEPGTYDALCEIMRCMERVAEIKEDSCKYAVLSVHDKVPHPVFKAKSNLQDCIIIVQGDIPQVQCCEAEKLSSLLFSLAAPVVASCLQD